MKRQANLKPKSAPQWTIGNDSGTAEALVAMGAQHVETAVDTCLADHGNRIVMVAVYMDEARIKDLLAGQPAQAGR